MSEHSPRNTYATPFTDHLKLVAVGAILLAIGIGIFYGLRQKSTEEAELTSHPRYTVGEIVKSGYIVSPNSHSYSRFTYQVGDSVYTESGPEQIPQGHTRFLVKFSAQHPTYYKFYERIPIPYYVPLPPPEGWAKPPPELDVPAGALD